MSGNPIVLVFLVSAKVESGIFYVFMVGDWMLSGILVGMDTLPQHKLTKITRTQAQKGKGYLDL